MAKGHDEDPILEAMKNTLHQNLEEVEARLFGKRPDGTLYMDGTDLRARYQDAIEVYGRVVGDEVEFEDPKIEVRRNQWGIIIPSENQPPHKITIATAKSTIHIDIREADDDSTIR